MKLYTAFATVGGLTLLSRALGFMRDILIAATLGSGWVADAFVVAFRFPNLFRRLFGEGAFNSAFVPIFAKKIEGEGLESARTFAEEAMAGLLFVLLVLTIIAEIGMPFFMYGLAPGFDVQPEKFDLAVLLTRITMPYLMCMCLVALMSGALNSVGKFAESSSVSIVLNGAMMAATMIALYFGYKAGPQAGIIQAWGVFVAGILQLWLLIWGMKRNGLALKLRRPRWTEDLRRLWQLGVPGIISGGVTQLNIAIGTIIASMQPGAVSHLYYADRIYELPLAIVGIAVGVVLLPDISRSLRSGDHAAVTDSQNRSLEFAMMLTIPAAVAICVIPGDIVRVLFQRGAFTHEDSVATAAVLALFALGLPAFVMIKVFSPAYFAREDTKTPMRFASISLAVNTAGSILLFFVFRHLGWRPQLGIAIATSVGGWLNAGLLWWTLHKRGDFDLDERFRRNLAWILIASAIMALVLYAMLGSVAPYMQAAHGFWVQSAALGVLVTAGLLSFGLVILASGVLSPAQLKRFVRRGR